MPDPLAGSAGDDPAPTPTPTSLVAAFEAAVQQAGERVGAGPELLPARLAHAAADVLGVSGAGISLTFPDRRRLPIGSSDADAVLAERLQFTEGEGPCWQAQETGRAVVAGPHEMADRWPAYAAALVAHTPYRAVVSLPLDGPLTGVGTNDLYLAGTAELRAVPIAATVAVSGRVTELLVSELAGGTPSAEPAADAALGGGTWLAAPAVAARTRVWQAMGVVDGDLRVSDTEALQLLRDRANADGRTLRQTASAVVEGRLTAADLAPRGTDVAPG